MSRPWFQSAVLHWILVISLAFLLLPGYPAVLAAEYNKQARKEFEKIRSLNRWFAYAHARPLPRYWPASFWSLRWKMPRPKKIKSRAGPLDRAAIKKVMRDNHRKIYDCYRWLLHWDSAPGGKLKFKIVIRPDGEVDKVTIVEETAKHPELQKCLLKVIKRLSFPRPDGFDPVEVYYPFVFDP